jgi:hypothetical protein
MLNKLAVACFIIATISVLATLMIILVDILSGFRFDNLPAVALFLFAMFALTAACGIILVTIGGMIV